MRCSVFAKDKLYRRIRFFSISPKRYGGGSIGGSRLAQMGVGQKTFEHNRKLSRCGPCEYEPTVRDGATRAYNGGHCVRPDPDPPRPGGGGAILASDESGIRKGSGA